MTGDDELLDLLGRTIGHDPTAEPDPADVTALRALVVERRDSPAAPIPLISARSWRQRALVGGVAAVVALSGATAVAAAVNDGALPGPVRAVAHAIGIPVDSIDLAAAKDALRRLRIATDIELPDALDRAERAVTTLSVTDRAALGQDADRTLAEARERLAKLRTAAPNAGAGDEASTATTAGPASSTPTGTTTATTTDDRRGSDTSGSSGSSGSTAAGSTATTDDDNSGHGGGSSASSSAGTTADDDSSGRGGHGGDSTTATTVPRSDTTDDHDNSGSGSGASGSGSGTSGSGGSGNDGSGSGGSGSDSGSGSGKGKGG